MSFIPNTTPTPNWLYNGEMKKMKETELKVVLLVTRKTLGWFDPMTEKRKTQDYISQSQFVEFTGQSHTAIAKAIQISVESGWIIARDKTGSLCETSEKRKRRKVWYQLGSVFTNKISGEKSSSNKSKQQSGLESKQQSGLDENLSNKVAKSKQLLCTHLSNKVANTIVTLTKENNTKDPPTPLKGDVADATGDPIPVLAVTLPDREMEIQVIPDLLADKKLHIQRIGLFARFKGVQFSSKEHQQEFIRRNVKASKALNPYSDEKIIKTLVYLHQHADFKVTMETIGKYIDEDLEKLTNSNSARSVVVG